MTAADAKTTARAGWINADRARPRGLDIIRKLASALSGYGGSLAFICVLAAFTAGAEATAMSTFVGLVKVISSQAPLDVTVPVINSHIVFAPSELFAASIAAVVSRAVLQLVLARRSTTMQIGYEAERRHQLFRAFIEASWRMQSEASAGELQTILTTNISLTRKLLGALANAAVAILNLAVFVGVAAAASPATVALLGGTAVVLFLVVRPLSNRARMLAYAKAELNIDYTNRVNDAVTMAKELRVFGVVDRFRAIVSDIVSRTARLSTGSQLLEALVPTAYQNLALLAMIGGLGVAASSSHADLGAAGLAALLLLRASSYSQGFQTVYHSVVETIPYLEQLSAYEKRYIESREPRGDACLGNVDELRMQNVAFSYRHGEPVLRDVSFSLVRGEILGIVGPSGGGKSTLVQLLLGLRTPSAGTYTVNKAPASSYDASSWAKHFAHVPQEAQLLPAVSVEENVSFLRAEVSRDDVLSACRSAHIDDEVRAIPEGYSWVVQERGGGLSGGQRQRLCIARALAAKPDVIILDEPTSALDVHSELKIQETLAALKGTVTLVIVAHRLSTLALCDKLLVLRDGAVEAFGTATDIRRENEYFASAAALSESA